MLFPTGNTPTADIPEVRKVTAKSCRELLKKQGKKKGTYDHFQHNTLISAQYYNTLTMFPRWFVQLAL